MNGIFKAVVVVQTLVTAIYAIALAYVIGYEHGVNSQLPIIQQLDRELHPDLLIDYFLWLHPLRNTLFGIGIILIICWAFVLLLVLQKRLSRPKQSYSYMLFL